MQRQRRWYLLAWDLDRSDWRTFRADRVAPRPPTGPRFAPRPLPSDAELSAWLDRHLAEADWQYRARVTVDAPADHVRSRLPVPVTVESLGDGRCSFEAGSDDPTKLALWLAMLGADFTVADAPELSDALVSLAERLLRAGSTPAK